MENKNKYWSNNKKTAFRWTLLIILTLDEIKFSAKTLIIIPIITGTVTTNAIFNAMPVIEIFFETTTPKNSAELMTTNGTDMMLIKLTNLLKWLMSTNARQMRNVCLEMVPNLGMYDSVCCIL